MKGERYPVDLIVRPFQVAVEGFGTFTYMARSRGRALAMAFEGWTNCYNDGSFKDFLRIVRSWRRDNTEGRFGEPIIVCGQPAYLVSYNSQYIQFVRPDSDVILNAHPLDVEPPEARRGTPYAAKDILHDQ